MAVVEGTWYPQSSEVLIWNADDAIRLRKEHRIIGSCIGQTSCCNDEVLPVRLMKDEVALLLEEGLLQLCPSHSDQDCSDQEWSYPKADGEKLRFAIFKELWKQGHYLTPGLKFGGDFLVYAGDPALCHAHSVAVIHQPEEGISLQKMAAHGRLCSMVKKTVLWCSLDQERRPFFLSQTRGTS